MIKSADAKMRDADILRRTATASALHSMPLGLYEPILQEVFGTRSQPSEISSLYKRALIEGCLVLSGKLESESHALAREAAKFLAPPPTTLLEEMPGFTGSRAIVPQVHIPTAKTGT